MRMICSIAAAGMLALTASAQAGEPVKLSDASLDQVTAGIQFLGLSFTEGARIQFQGGDAGGSLFEASTSRFTRTNGSTRITTFGSVDASARGQRSFASGFASSFVCVGTCGFPDVGGGATPAAD